MKRKLGLLGMVVGAVALALVGVLQDVSTSKAIMPLPVRPLRINPTTAGGNSTNQLGAVVDAYGASNGGRGERSAAYAGWSRGGVGFGDIEITDGVPLGDFLSVSDFQCDSLNDTDGDIVGYDTGGVPTPYTFNEGNTDLAAAGLAYLQARAGTFPMTARFGSSITQVMLYGTQKLDLTNPIPVNIFTLRVPWSMDSGVSQIWIGGAAAKPGALCTDSAENTIKAPLGSTSHTMGSWTSPKALTRNPSIKGDAAGPCNGPDCADKQVRGYWPSKSIVDASGGAQAITVTQRALNAGPGTGDFKDVWHILAPTSVTATWSATITEKSSASYTSSWVSETAPTVTGGGTAEISFVEDGPVAGSTYEDVGTLNVTCGGTGDYIVTIKTASYPVSPTVDNDLSSNVALSTIRVKCNATPPAEVDAQVIALSSKISGISGLNAAESAGFNPAIGVVNDGCPAVGPAESGTACADNVDSDADTVVNDGCPQVGGTAETGAQCTNAIDDDGDITDTPPGDHTQLRVGDKATLTVQTLLRNVGSQDAASQNLLVAEGPDMDGNGTYDITLNWVDGSTTAKYGSDPASLTTLTAPDTCKAGGGMSCAGLDVSPLTEPHGPMIKVEASLEVTCNTAGRFLVPVKSVNIPTALGDSSPINNVQWHSLTVYCWDSAAAKATSDDGIEDNTGLYPTFTTYTTEPDARKSVSPTSKPATGIASDTGYIERYEVSTCFWNDINDNAPKTGGWVSWQQSLLDPDLVTMGGWAHIDADGDCLVNADHAQPGRPVDSNDVPATGPDSMCPAIVYNEGKAPLAQVQFNKSADQDCDGLTDGNEYVLGSNPKLADSDGDGATDWVEVFQMSNPLNPDTDGDGFKDAPAATYQNSNTAYDNCPIIYNPGQENNDGKRRDNGDAIPGLYSSNPNQDKMGDACDEDDDNDLSPDIAETTVSPTTDPLKMDTDGDGCGDGWESLNGKDPTDKTKKCPATISAGLQSQAKGCHLNLPGTAIAPDFAPGYNGDQWVEMDADGDGLLCQTSGVITDLDSDNGTGSGAKAPDEVNDVVEAFGYNTAIGRVDTDGDGCPDWVEIADVSGDRVSNINDIAWVAKRVFNAPPFVSGVATTSDPVLDMNKDGAFSIADVSLVAKNSTVVKTQTPNPCPNEN